MKRWALFLLASALSAKSIPQGYTLPLPLDVFTKPTLETHFGTLTFDDGVPAPKTKEKIQNELRYLQLSQSYFENYEAVWLEEVRRSLSLQPNKEVVWTYSPLHAKTLWPKLDPQRVYAVMLLKTNEHPLSLHMPDSLNHAVLLDSWGEEVGILRADTNYCIISNDANLSCMQNENNDTTILQEENITTEELFSLFEDNNTAETNVTKIEQEPIQKLSVATHYSYLFMQFSRDTNLSKIPKTLHAKRDGNLSIALEFIDTSNQTSIAIVPQSARFFKLLHTITQRDVASDTQSKKLRALGIQKGEPFQPKATMRQAMQEAAVSAGVIAKNTPHLSKLKALQENNVSAFILQSSDGNTTFNGANKYTLHIAPNLGKWSVTLYDTQTKSMMQNSLEPFPYRQSDDPSLVKNEDGSIDLCIAPQLLPTFSKQNTLLSVPLKRWFAIIRFYDKSKQETKQTFFIQPLKKSQQIEEKEDESIELY